MMNSRRKGAIGEWIACKFLINKGFYVRQRNYRKAWGEIDIIAVKDGMVHFFEVKSVTRFHGKPGTDVHRPEDNVHAAKAQHIRRMIQTYFAEDAGKSQQNFAFHVLCVYLDSEKRKAEIKWVRDVIL